MQNRRYVRAPRGRRFPKGFAEKYFSAALILLAATLAACASSVPATPPTSLTGALPMQRVTSLARKSWVAAEVRNAGERLVYVASGNAIIIYKARGNDRRPDGVLRTDITMPTSVWVDMHRNLWVANIDKESPSGISSTVLRFAQGSTAPDLVLSDPNWLPTWVSVGPKGAVYVVNTPYSGYSEVLEYPRHQSSPEIITDPQLAYLTNAVVEDANGDLFADGINSQRLGAEVDERPAGSKTWQNTGIMGLGEPGGLGFDALGNLVVSDPLFGVIDTFPPGQTTASNSIACSLQCISFAFGADGKRLWVDEYNDARGGVGIDELAYPGGTLIDRIPQRINSSLSVAVAPALYP